MGIVGDHEGRLVASCDEPGQIPVRASLRLLHRSPALQMMPPTRWCPSCALPSSTPYGVGLAFEPPREYSSLPVDGEAPDPLVPEGVATNQTSLTPWPLTSPAAASAAK